MNAYKQKMHKAEHVGWIVHSILSYLLYYTLYNFYLYQRYHEYCCIATATFQTISIKKETLHLLFQVEK